MGPYISSKAEKNILGEQTSKLKLTGSVQIRVPIVTKDDISIGKNLQVEGESVFKGNITAPNVIYSLKGGTNVTITGDKQNPTVSVNINKLVSSFQGLTGDIELKPGT